MLAFLLLCAGAWLFLQPFTSTGGEALPYVDWETTVWVDGDGAEHPLDPLEGQPELPEGAFFRFALTLPQRGDDYALVFETGNMDFTLSLDGETFFSTQSLELPEALNQSRVNISLPTGGGERLVMEMTPLGQIGIFPPLPRLASDALETAGQMAYANHYAIPAGATTLATLLLWGLFLVGAYQGRPPWKLLLLVFAAGELTFYSLALGFGSYFLSQELLPFLSWRGWPLLGIAAMAAYLLLHREKSFWKALGLATLCSVGLFLACWGISWSQGGYLARYVASMALEIASGYWDRLFYWLSLWLVIVCTVLSSWEVVRTILQTWVKNRSLELKDQLVMENYRSLEERLREEAAVRHESSHRLAALEAMLQEGDLEGLRENLAQWKTQNSQTVPRYTANFAVNSILQDTASKAKAAGIAFTAEAQIPEKLPLSHQDLCALLMNLLDNALEAAAQVEEPSQRFLRLRLSLQKGFLAVRCENSYTGKLAQDGKGNLLTTKENPQTHGFGIAKMSAVAEKYKSILDIRYTDSVFTVQTALKLPGEARQTKSAPA